MIDSIAHWLHLVAAILLMGNTLFWVVMAIGAARSTPSTESAHLLGLINSGRWPHVIVPRPLRLPFSALAWIFVVVLGASGVFLLQSHGALGPVAPESGMEDRFADFMRVKLALLGLLLLGLAQATVEPRRWLAFVNGGLALTIIAVSVLLER